MDIELTKIPHPDQKIIETVFEVVSADDRSKDCHSYFTYCNDELGLLRRGVSQQNWQITTLAARTLGDVAHIIDVLRRETSKTRHEIRNQLHARFPRASFIELNRSINLALRLWLMLNYQDQDFETLRHEATCISWNETVGLEQHIESLFPPGRWQVDAATSRLGPHFTAVFLHKVCGIELEWTTSLFDHLRLDRGKGVLMVFPYKCHLEQLILAHRSNTPPPIPCKVLEETLLTLSLLFPLWDRETVMLLEKEKQTFHETGPFTSQTLTLMDFDNWRDRLLELREVLESPPVSWAQLWRDRRNPQQFWTFWIALFILLLTILSFVASVVQAWAAVKALNMH